MGGKRILPWKIFIVELVVFEPVVEVVSEFFVNVELHTTILRLVLLLRIVALLHGAGVSALLSIRILRGISARFKGTFEALAL